MLATLPHLQPSDFPALVRGELTTLQVNLGYVCNQSCLHCHVNAGPKRTESMSEDTVWDIIEFLQDNRISTLDLTGGAPELNPHFRMLVKAAREAGVHVMDRCNLTVLSEPGQEDLAEFLSNYQVEVVASMPCYLEENVDAQRGDGVFDGSIAGLKKLNELGYGKQYSGRLLNLVYNPQGPSLPPAQCGLEQDYKKHLDERYGIIFNNLLTLANMPIQRFGSTLLSHGQFEEYMALLKSSHRDENLAQVMCRNLVSIDWKGYLFDCDFNQMLDLPLEDNEQRLHIRDLKPEMLDKRSIVVADHCYGCTAGQGSSCGGALDI